MRCPRLECRESETRGIPAVSSGFALTSSGSSSCLYRGPGIPRTQGRAKHLNDRPLVREVHFLELPYRLAVAIFRDSIRAYADADYDLAQTLKSKDRELDALTHDVTGKLVERATMDSELVPSYVDLVFVARALERIGDHATNIAEDSFWRDQATDIRHTYGAKRED